jgi:flagellar biosynthesis protein
MSESRKPAAVALRWSEAEEAAPSVVAKGEGALAERLLALAREHGVPVREDSDLMQLLSLCDLGEEIPADLYAAVAEILLHVWRLNEELRGSA